MLRTNFLRISRVVQGSPCRDAPCRKGRAAYGLRRDVDRANTILYEDFYKKGPLFLLDDLLRKYCACAVALLNA